MPGTTEFKDNHDLFEFIWYGLQAGMHGRLAIGGWMEHLDGDDDFHGSRNSYRVRHRLYPIWCRRGIVRDTICEAMEAKD